MSATALSCQELVELVTDFLDGALSPAEHARFEDHLSICPGCRTYVEQFRATIAITGSLRDEDVPAAARDELLVQFQNWKTETA